MTTQRLDPSLANHGVLLLNKPQGITSNKALQEVKRLLELTKVGHTGTLDPLATGMLPLCFGEATKCCHYLLEVDKCYEATGLLGIKTTTADSTGELLSQVEDFSISPAQFNEVLTHYRGTITQIPSMFSALKHQGVPLYRLARKGVEVARQPREVLIHQLDLNAFDGRSFSLTVTCSKGTYIRNLLEDIGEELGVGAHLTRLHRVYTSGFQDRPMYTLEALRAMTLSQRRQCMIPMEEVLGHLSPLELSDEDVLFIRQGKVLGNKTKGDSTQTIRLYTSQQVFIGLGEWLNAESIKAKRLLAF